MNENEKDMIEVTFPSLCCNGGIDELIKLNQESINRLLLTVEETNAKAIEQIILKVSKTIKRVNNHSQKINELVDKVNAQSEAIVKLIEKYETTMNACPPIDIGTTILP